MLCMQMRHFPNTTPRGLSGALYIILVQRGGFVPLSLLFLLYEAVSPILTRT